MRKVLVIGGAGFIGQKVVQELVEKNCDVSVLDLERFQMEGAEIRSYVGSILDPYKLSEAVRGSDYVIHLAAALGVQHTDINRLECLYINIQGTVNVLEACVRENVKKVIFSSSSEVYGDQIFQPVSEDAPLNPKSIYAVSKIVGEEYLRAYAQRYGMDYNIVRFFNVYGAGQRENFVMTKFVKNVFMDASPLIYGSGEQSRCFCYVSDAARGLVDVLFSSAESGIFNIGNDTEPISIKELAYKTITVLGKSLEPQFVSYDDSDRESGRDVVNRIPSIEKVKKTVNYQPLISLEEGIKKMFEYYENVVKLKDVKV